MALARAVGWFLVRFVGGPLAALAAVQGTGVGGWPALLVALFVVGIVNAIGTRDQGEA